MTVPYAVGLQIARRFHDGSENLVFLEYGQNVTRISFFFSSKYMSSKHFEKRSQKRTQLNHSDLDASYEQCVQLILFQLYLLKPNLCEPWISNRIITGFQKKVATNHHLLYNTVSNKQSSDHFFFHFIGTLNPCFS